MTERSPIGGIHSVRAALRFGAQGVDALWIERGRRDRRLETLIELARAAGVRLRQVERDALEREAPGVNHQGVIAWVRVPAARPESELFALLDRLATLPFLLFLDEVQDPHNLGACLRTAEAAGVQAVIAPKDRAVGLTPVVCRVASGAATSLPYIQVTNLVRVMKQLKERGIWLVGAVPDSSQEIYDLDLTGPLGIVLGNEGKGLRRLTRECCDYLARIPMLGQMESLNISVAAGICLYEALRQRRLKPGYPARKSIDE